jgi:hypothetical protein
VILTVGDVMDRLVLIDRNGDAVEDSTVSGRSVVDWIISVSVLPFVATVVCRA